MKRFLWIAVFLIATVSACSDTEGDPPPAETSTPATPTTTSPDTLERYESPELGFAISYPATWTVEPSPDEGLVLFSAPVAAFGLTPNFNVRTGAVPGPAADYYGGAAARLTQNLPGVEILEEADIGVDGFPGHGVTIVSTEGDVAVGISQMIVLVNGRAWEVTFLADANELGELSSLVNGVFQSFQLLRG